MHLLRRWNGEKRMGFGQMILGKNFMYMITVGAGGIVLSSSTIANSNGGLSYV